jgi:hypothetical protein
MAALSTSSTRSVGMNLARRSNAGSERPFALVASATVDNRAFQASLARREHTETLCPALKRRAKFMPTLRVENIAKSIRNFPHSGWLHNRRESRFIFVFAE